MQIKNYYKIILLIGISISLNQAYSEESVNILPEMKGIWKYEEKDGKISELDFCNLNGLKSTSYQNGRQLISYNIKIKRHYLMKKDGGKGVYKDWHWFNYSIIEMGKKENNANHGRFEYNSKSKKIKFYYAEGDSDEEHVLVYKKYPCPV